MGVTIAAVMRHVNNYFQRAEETISGTISITGGAVTPTVAAPYVCIHGSAHHDGVHRLGELEGADETFTGTIWQLYPPADFIDLCQQIAAFDTETPLSPLQSESLGEYSYTRAQGKTAAVLSWHEAFAISLAPYRRMFTEVKA